MPLFETPNKKKGLIGTILFHCILLLAFILLGLTHKEPLPQRGITLNFGTSDVGSGETQPTDAAQPEPVDQIPDEIDAAPQQTETVEEVTTQENKETIEAPEATKKQTVEEKKPEISDELKQTLSNAFNKNKKNPTGEGDDKKAGDKGKVTGTLDGKSYTGEGGGGNGTSFELSGRQSLRLPKPQDDSQEEGKVVVSIKVNKNGDVIEAIPGVKGSTIYNGPLLEKAKQAALKAKFSANPNAAIEQKGTITYVFVLQ